MKHFHIKVLKYGFFSCGLRNRKGLQGYSPKCQGNRHGCEFVLQPPIRSRIHHVKRRPVRKVPAV